MKNQYQEIVLKATSYIKANLQEPISIPKLAGHLGYSIRHVRNAFRKTLNQSIIDHIRGARLAKAKDLLQKTSLPVMQISLEAGFESYAHFSRVFRGATKMTPSQFRSMVLHLGEVPAAEADLSDLEAKEDYFKDLFASKDLAPHWNALVGAWSSEKGMMVASRHSNRIGLARPLPENCRISFELFVTPNPQGRSADAFIHLTDRTYANFYCGIKLAAAETVAGEFLHLQQGRRWISDARLTEDEWNAVVLEIKDDLLCCQINGKQIFSFRETFPIALVNRSHLCLGTWNCSGNFRKFAIQNLGFAPAMRPVRQGDTLYNSGLFEKALEFYLRYLKAGPVSDAETMELRYKIGMCHIHLKAFSQARNWMDKIVILKEDPFWAEKARLAHLEIDWKVLDLERFKDDLALCMTEEKMRDDARSIAQFAIHDFTSRGFFPEAIAVADFWSCVEHGKDYAYLEARTHLTESLVSIRKYREAEQVLRDIYISGFSGELGIRSRMNLMQLLHECGKIPESETVRKEIEAATEDEFWLARCTIQKALNLRAREELNDMIAVLKELPILYPNVESGYLAHAEIHSAFALCCLGQTKEGREILNSVAQKGVFLNSRHFLPFNLMEKNYAASAESLLSEYKNSANLVSASAEFGVKAGILHELAGKIEEAKSILKEVSQRFPNEQVRFFGLLAGALLLEDKFDFAQMPYEHFRRSEMFYLIGLLREKRGDKETARALFELSVKDDPALRWPAWFAKRKLNSVSSAFQS